MDIRTMLIAQKRGHSSQASSSVPEPAPSAKRAKTDGDFDEAERTEAQLDLEMLLNLTAVQDQAQLQERFDTIAKALLCDYDLVVNQPEKSTKLEIMELEFYVQKEGFHEDPFTHGNEEQAVSGMWYFHRAPRRSTDANRSLTSSTEWRGGSRKGLDITIGRPLSSSTNPSDEEGPSAAPAQTTLLRGGILLRTIAIPGLNTKVVQGPSLLVDEILSRSGVTSIAELVNEKWNGTKSAFPTKCGATPPPTYSLQFIPKPRKAEPALGVKKPVIYSSPRIGLDLSHPGTTGPSVRPLHSRIRFLPRTYRYFRDPALLTGNGRPQTFVGVLLHCAKTLIERLKSKKTDPGTLSPEEEFTQVLKDPRLLTEITKISGIKQPTAQRYLNDYMLGRKGGEKVVEAFIGLPGKGASSSPSSYLKLMGALSTLTLDP